MAIPGVIFYFTLCIFVFSIVLLVGVLTRCIPIVCCFRFIPCLRKKKTAPRGGGGGDKKRDGTKNKQDDKLTVAETVTATDRRKSEATKPILDTCVAAPFPNMEIAFQYARFMVDIVAHEQRQGSAVAYETINTRALSKERAYATRLYRIASVIGSLVEFDELIKETLTGKVSAGFAEACALASEGLKSTTNPKRGKFCLDRATAIFIVLIKELTSAPGGTFSQFQGAESWAVGAKQVKILDAHVMACFKILHTPPPVRCCHWFRARSIQLMQHDYPPIPDVEDDKVLAVVIKQESEAQFAKLEQMQSIKASKMAMTDLVVVPEASADIEVAQDHDASVASTPVMNDTFVPSFSRSVSFQVEEDDVSILEAEEIDVYQTESVSAAPANRQVSKRGLLVRMASQMFNNAMESIVEVEESQRRMSVRMSVVSTGPSMKKLGDIKGLGSVRANFTAQSYRGISFLERTVQKMQTERAMTSILASSPAAKLPDLDKIFTHADLCADMVATHDDDDASTTAAAVTPLGNTVSQTDRIEAVRIYRIVALFCKLLHLDPSSLTDDLSNKIAPGLAEAQALITEGLKSNTLPEKATESLRRGTQLLLEVCLILTQGPFTSFSNATAWEYDGKEIKALDEYVHDAVMLFDEEPHRTLCNRIFHRMPLVWKHLWDAFGLPDSMRNHPIFYFLFLFVYGGIIIHLFVFTCDFSTNELLAGNVTFSIVGKVPAHVCLQQRGRTYLGVGGQYKAVLGLGGPADVMIPLLFGIMHSLLFLFGAIPITMSRGFWRDVSYWLPISRQLLPIDDHIFFHKFIGYLALINLFVGAVIWVLIMGYAECLMGKRHAACTSWDGLIVKNWFNLFENVVMLRVVVITTWFFIIPLMRYQTQPPTYWCFGMCCGRRLPMWFRAQWFEIIYVLHVTVALTTVILALAARFEVFHPILAPWALYILDSLRETYCMTFATQINLAKTTIHLDPQDANKPTTLTVHFSNPRRAWWRGGILRTNMAQGEGMWVFLKIPSISNLEWHPFSLASASGDDFAELQIGIRPGVIPKRKRVDNWELDVTSERAKITGEGEWAQIHGPTFTYKVFDALKKAQIGDSIPCLMRGPYGSSFRVCFNPSTKGALIMAAGSGLSAIESMLRGMLHRRKTGAYTPHSVWVCWQCRRVGDILWVWDSLNALLIQALNDGTLVKPANWTPASKTLDFLTLTFFISRGDGSQVETLRSLPKHPEDKHKVHEFLTSRNRLFQSSISSESTHIGKYIRNIRATLNRRGLRRNEKLGICFCGPSAVARIISDAAYDVGGSVEFSADAAA